MAFSIYEQQKENAARRRALAEQMAEQARQPIQSQVAPGGLVVPTGLAEIGAKLGAAWIARRQGKKAKAEDEAAQGAHDTAMSEALKQYSGAVPDEDIGAASYNSIMNAPEGELAEPTYGKSESQAKLLDEMMPRDEIAKLMVQQQMAADAPVTLGPGQRRFQNGKVIAEVPAARPGLQHVSRDTGAEIEGGTFAPDTGETRWTERTPKALSPAQAGGQFSERHGGLLAAIATRGISLPAGLRSREQIRATLDGLIAKYPTMGDDELADNLANGKIRFTAENKASQMAASQAGRVMVGLNEINEFAPLVLDASSKVDRGTFMPINRLMNTAEGELSDSNLRELKIAINAMLNAYDQVAARGGTDMAKRAEAHSLLTSADSPEVLASAVTMFQREAAAAERAAQQAMRPGNAPEAKTPPTNSRGWTLHVDAQGNRAYVSPDGKQFEEVR